MSTADIRFSVFGHPRPQGSKKAWVNQKTGRAQMRESSGEHLTTWREDVKHAALDYIASREGTGDPFAILGGPVRVVITFRFARPKSHFRTGRNAHLLRDQAPAFPITRANGDIEKLVRSTHDALTAAGIWVDDSQVAGCNVWKVFADQKVGLPGAHIWISSLADTHLEHAAQRRDENGQVA